jgi:hypothetical protein
MVKVIARVSRIERRCEGCRGIIGVGERYLSHVASPRHDDLNNEHWWRSPECAECAQRYGREALLVKAG